jgi:hypothetical protein
MLLATATTSLPSVPPTLMQKMLPATTPTLPSVPPTPTHDKDDIEENRPRHEVLSVYDGSELSSEPLELNPAMESLHLEGLDHKRHWSYFPLGCFPYTTTLTELTLDVPLALGPSDAIAMANKFPNIDTLRINVLLVRDPKFFEALAAFTSLTNLTLLMNTSFQNEFKAWNIFAIKQLQTLTLISSSMDLHALITFAAVCVTPKNLETIIIERPASNRGSLHNKRHVKLDHDVEYQVERLQHLPPREFYSNQRVFMDTPVRVLFPSLKNIFVCADFARKHNMSQVKGLGRIVGKGKRKRSQGVNTVPTAKTLKLSF